MTIPRQHTPFTPYPLTFDPAPPNPTGGTPHTGLGTNIVTNIGTGTGAGSGAGGAGRDRGRRADREVLQITEPGQLLTAIAFGLGYQPTEPGLIVVGIAHGEMVCATRLDLPALHALPPGGLPVLWAVFEPLLASTAVEEVVVIGHLDRSWVSPLRRFADTGPLPVTDLLRVHDGRWWFLNCLVNDCTHPGCTYFGAALTQDNEVAATMVANGHPVPRTREDLTAALQPGPADVLAAVRSELAALRRGPRPSRRALHDALRDARDARVDGPAPLTPAQAAVLLHALTDLLIRDHCITWTDPASSWLWHDLIRTAPPGTVAPVATLIAVAAYQNGEGTQTRIAIDIALADNPGYHLAHLIDQCLRVGLAPDAIRDGVAATAARLGDVPDDTTPGQQQPEEPHTDLPHNDLPHNDLPHNDLPHNDLPHNDLPHNDLPHNDHPDNEPTHDHPADDEQSVGQADGPAEGPAGLTP